MRLNPAEVEQATKIRGYFRRPRSWRSAKRQFERTGKFPWQRFYLPGGKDIWEFHHGPYEDCLRDWQKRGCRIVKGRGVSSA